MYDIVYVYVRVHAILEFLQMTCLFSRLSLCEPEAMTTLHVAIIFLVLAELKMGGSSDDFPMVMAHGLVSHGKLLYMKFMNRIMNILNIFLNALFPSSRYACHAWKQSLSF